MLGTRKDENIKAYRLFVIDRYLNDAINKKYVVRIIKTYVL